MLILFSDFRQLSWGSPSIWASSDLAWHCFSFQMFVSRLTAYFRRKCVTVTDDRVQKMNEVLTYIKFIKMYAWVKAFSQSVQSELRNILNAWSRGFCILWIWSFTYFASWAHYILGFLIFRILMSYIFMFKSGLRDSNSTSSHTWETWDLEMLIFFFF
jgi:hypothetical protein